MLLSSILKNIFKKPDDHFSLPTSPHIHRFGPALSCRKTRCFFRLMAKVYASTNTNFMEYAAFTLKMGLGITWTLSNIIGATMICQNCIQHLLIIQKIHLSEQCHLNHHLITPDPCAPLMGCATILSRYPSTPASITL